MYGDGEQTRDYVYVGDVAAAFAAASAADGGGPYNIGTGIETSVLELGRQIGEACGKAFEPEFAPARIGEIKRTVIDPARAGEELGWRPSVTLVEGLAPILGTIADPA